MKNLCKLLAGISLLIFVQKTFSQTKKEIALLHAKQALYYEDSGKYKEAIPLLEKAIKLDSGNINYPYELAIAYCNSNEYLKAQNILEPLLTHPNVSGMVYHILGNVYDNLGKPALAISTYETGIKLFPKSGAIYFELGNIQLKKKDFNIALDWFEKGIVAEPGYASNYYRAAILFFNSSEPVWGMIYGEIFLNLEKNTLRTSAMSKLLFDNYRKNIRLPKDSSFSVSFFTTIALLADKNKKPFAKTVYEPTIMLSILPEKGVDLHSLCRMRKRFIESYIRSENYLRYPNVLFDYQYRVLKAGYMDAYNHWILQEGNQQAYKAWISANSKQWDNFIKWFIKNNIPLDDNYKFFRAQY